MEWQPYKACCIRSAAEPSRETCSCGHVLIRCAAFAECGTLVAPMQPCPSCVAPVLWINAGAVTIAKARERMSLPLVLRNASPSGRTLWLKSVVRRDGRMEEQITPEWEEIAPGTERELPLKTAPMDEGGTYTLNLIFVLATRYKGLEDEYAFTAGVSVRVAASEKGPEHVAVNVSGDSHGTAAGHKVIAHVPVDRAAEMAATALDQPKMLTLERAERWELEQGLRGYARERLRVPRHAEIQFVGFNPHDTPRRGPALALRGRMLFGRNSRTADVTANAAPNDICLRVFEARSKAVDEPATMAISRHHFELVVVNDRLCVHARATGGMQVNAKDLAPGEVMPIVPGDRIVPIPGHADKLTLRVGFTTAIGVVERIYVSRAPAYS